MDKDTMTQRRATRAPPQNRQGQGARGGRGGAGGRRDDRQEGERRRGPIVQRGRRGKDVDDERNFDWKDEISTRRQQAARMRDPNDLWVWEHEYNQMVEEYPPIAREDFQEWQSEQIQSRAVEMGINAYLGTETVGSTPVLWEDLEPTPQSSLDIYTSYERNEGYVAYSPHLTEEERESYRAMLEGRFEIVKAGLASEVSAREEVGEKDQIEEVIAGCQHWSDEQWEEAKKQMIEEAIFELERQRYDHGQLKMSHLHAKDEEKVMELVAFHGVKKGSVGEAHTRVILDALKTNAKWSFYDKLTFLRTSRRIAAQFGSEPMNQPETRFVWPFPMGMEAVRKIIWPDGEPEEEPRWGYETAPWYKVLERRKKHAGRNAHGRITSHRRGGGHKRRYRRIDFRRRTWRPRRASSVASCSRTRCSTTSWVTTLR